MKAQFNQKRYVKTFDGWFVQLREGDEKFETNHLRPCIKIYENYDMPVAGPFYTKLAMRRWMEGFLSFYSHSRAPQKNYISDSIIFSDTNTMYC